MVKIFEGVVGIYLQGKDALTDGQKDESNNLYTKFLVGARPDLACEDLRELNWSDVDGFNVPSAVEIFYDFKTDTMKIVLKKAVGNKEVKKTLVFGVIWDNSIPAYDCDWEVFKPSTVGENAISFVTLVNNN